MAVILSELRVSASMDASGYTAGAGAVDDANRRMAASGQAAGAAMAAQDAAAGRTGGTLITLSRGYIDGYSSAARLNTEVARLQTQFELGNVSADRAAQIYTGISGKLNLYADATKIAAGGNKEFASVIDSVNAKAALQIDILGRAAAAQQRSAQALASQSQINSRLGVVEPGTNTASSQADIIAYGQALDDVRAKYVPLAKEQKQYLTDLADIRSNVKNGALSQREGAAAIARTKEEFAAQVIMMRAASEAAGGHGRALGGMQTQASALAAALRHGFDAMAAGMSPMRVIMMEAGNLSYGLSGVGTVLGWLKDKLLAVAGWFTPAKIAVLALGAAFSFTMASIFSWSAAQREVVLGLSGIGRASGVTVANINALADAHSSLATVSVRQGRNTAVALAATGKVGADVIGDLIGLSHDFAKAFGVDNAKAAQLLAKSFADPVKGADELNMRLGFLSAATQRNIQDLVSQNRLYEAQKIIVDGLKSSLPKTVEVTGSFSQFLNYVTNAASNGFTAVGKWISDINGWSATANEQLKSAQEALAKLEAQPDPWIGPKRGVKELKDEIAKLQAAIEATDRATASAKSNLDSLAVSAATFSAIPEIDVVRGVRNRAAVTGRVAEDPVLQQSLGLTQSQADQAAARMKELTAGWEQFRTEAALTAAQTRIAIAAITARSPEEKAAIAMAQTRLQLVRQGLDPDEKSLQIQLAGARAAKEVQFALSEAARTRLAAIKDAIGQSEIDVSVIGKNVQQTTLLQENWKAYVELRREAAQNHTAFDNAQYERLKRENEELARKKQLAENAKIAYDIQRDSQTAFLTSEDVQIAEKLKGKYEDVATALNSVEAAQMRANNAVRGLSQELSGGLSTALLDISMGTKQTGEAFRSFGLMAVQALQRMIVQLMIIGPLMRALQGAFGGGFLGLLGLGGGGFSPDGSAKGNVFDQGRIIHPYALGGITSDILVKPTYFPMANGGIGLGGEAGPEAIMPLRRGSDGRLGVSGLGGAGFVFAPVYNIDASGSNMTEKQFTAILAKNNEQVIKDVKRALPDQVAAINRDPRRRG